MVNIFKEYMAALERLGSHKQAFEDTFSAETMVLKTFFAEKATGRIEQPSERVENQINVLVQSGTFEGCQSIIQNVMDDCASATFTLPVKSADGLYIAIGHYSKASDELPEL